MKNVIIALISSLVISMSAVADVSFAADSVSLEGVGAYNPTNDPKDQTIVGMGIERLNVQHCGSQKDVSMILPRIQGVDTYDLTHRFMKFNEDGAPEYVDIQLTGNYSWIKNTMFLNLDDASRTVLLNLIQFEMDQLCDNDATLIPRSITIVKNEVKTFGDKRVSGVLQVKAMHHARAGYVDNRVRKFGTVTYTLQIKGGLQ